MTTPDKKAPMTPFKDAEKDAITDREVVQKAGRQAATEPGATIEEKKINRVVDETMEGDPPNRDKDEHADAHLDRPSMSTQAEEAVDHASETPEH